jgi:hypothetical protein
MMNDGGFAAYEKNLAARVLPHRRVSAVIARNAAHPS